MQGCLDWQIHGLGEPEEVVQVTAAYRAEMDVLGTFLSDCCRTGDALEVTAKALFKAYENWCEQSGEKPISSNGFSRKLSERGFIRRKSAGNVWWRGLVLATE